ncbi:Crp/Fnr family transcriptional regulator [Tardiphaga alba]|uniref:Crp/Fnr family transcriptional regulator n=1 Tax=Tardiphaga alba TaxID=340268 RepID=A0ABX8ADT6_9BRAD|nr:Crp/Fnr family transcriptional regulator [Tardiphaga alba]QUS39980.1 Crp/Fnr family transcriptional regulator [Tardiphaga alba]
MDRGNGKTFAEAPLFFGLNEGARARIVEAGKRLTLDTSFALWQQGDAPDIVAFVLDGQLKEAVIDAEGGQKTLRFMRRGDCIGCSSVYGDFPYPATATATMTTELMYWSGERFTNLMHAHSQLAINVLGIVGRRSARLLRRLHEATSENADRRLARIILRLANVADIRMSETPVELTISRQELAELSDTTLFTVSRTVSAWHRLQIVKAGRGRLVITDLGRLAGLAGAAIMECAQDA